MKRPSRFVLKLPIALAACLMAVMRLPASLASPAARTAPAVKAAAAGSETKGSMVDVNTADVEMLTDLPGIGPAIAQRIVDYRKEHGPFKSLDELLNVRGVGERMLEKLRSRLTIGAKG